MVDVWKESAAVIELGQYENTDRFTENRRPTTVTSTMITKGMSKPLCFELVEISDQPKFVQCPKDAKSL